MTQERIWRLDEGGDPTPLTETAYDSEAALQKLIADHPEVLAGERMTPDEPRRWLLISREMGIPDSPDSGDRWAVDHLLLDQDARPTLVEVKRGDNPEIRRRVVGQMLDYAAHATRYWTADTIRERLEAESGGEDAARGRIARLQSGGESGDGAYEEFWERVDRNLADERIRLLFVADRIPPDLEHVVEFLNRHMGPQVEVLAVELKQFRSADFRTLVPRVIGRSDGRAPGEQYPTHPDDGDVPTGIPGRRLCARLPESCWNDRDCSRCECSLGPNRRASASGARRGRSVSVAWLSPEGNRTLGWQTRLLLRRQHLRRLRRPAATAGTPGGSASVRGQFEGDSWSHDAQLQQGRYRTGGRSRPMTSRRTSRRSRRASRRYCGELAALPPGRRVGLDRHIAIGPHPR